MKYIAEQTNVYAMQTDGEELGISADDIEKFIGILILSGIYSCPSYRMYWETASRFPAIADIMSRSKFDSLLRYSHFNNNDNMKAKDDPDYDPLFKVRPLLDSLREQLKTVEQEERQCIDEQMIPFKGRSGLKQFVKNKPWKWEFKVFTRSGVPGMMYDFEIYTGKKINFRGDFGISRSSIIRVVDNLPQERHLGHSISFQHNLYKNYSHPFRLSPSLSLCCIEIISRISAQYLYIILKINDCTQKYQKATPFFRSISLWKLVLLLIPGSQFCLKCVQ